MKVEEPRHADPEEAETRSCGKLRLVSLRGADARESSAATVVVHLCLRAAPPPPAAVGVNISAAADGPHEAADHLWHMRKQPRVAGRAQSLRL